MSLPESARQPGQNRRSGRPEFVVFVVLLAIAAFFRFNQLNDIPPGMTHDEAAFGAEAERILSGQRPLYFALGYGHEPFYAYLVAGAFSWLGRSLSALRLTSAVCGMWVVLFTYIVARRVYDARPAPTQTQDAPRMAWVSTAWMAVAFWPVSLSRQALRAITLPAVWLPAAWLFWEGMQIPRRSEDADPPNAPHPAAFYLRLVVLCALSGLFLGASFYTYMASRLAWLVFPLLALYMLLRQETRRALARSWPGIVIMLLVAVLVALPLARYLLAHPASEIRVGLMMEPIRELLAGQPDRALGHAWNAVRVFSWIGDRFWAYNIPGRPVFDVVGSVLFYLGLAVALWRWKDPRYAFLLLWLLVGMAPALVTTNEGIFLRAIVAQPATYLLVSVGTWAIGRAMSKVGGWVKLSEPSISVAWNVLAVALVMLEANRTAQAYFIDWPSRPEARNIYNYNLVASARYLGAADAPASAAVGISALYPLYYHDPWILRYVAGRDDLEVRWFDGRGAIVYPAEGEARFVFSSLTPLHPALRDEFEAQATLIERRTLDERDQNPAFEVWRWQGREALSERLSELEAASPMWVSPEVQFTQPEQRQRLEESARFGDLVDLIGYRFDYRMNETSAPKDRVVLVTYWRALRTAVDEDDWKTFVHLLDVDSQVIGGVDVLNAPPTGWLPGDVIAQVHSFDVDPDLAAGETYLEVGVYRHEGERLPVIVDGQAAGNRVLLAPAPTE